MLFVNKNISLQEGEQMSPPEKRTRNPEVIISPQFAKAATVKIKEMKTNPRKLSAKLEMQYDTLRKICKGVGFPHQDNLELICNELGLDIDKMNEIINQDRLISKGGLPFEMLDPFLIDINEIFVSLPRKDKKAILDEVKRLHAIHNG
jgi:hypothetical protein